MTHGRLVVVGAALAALGLAGCAEVTPPTPGEMLENPLGKSPLRLGMTQDEVRAMWGEPDSVERSAPDPWGTERQIWVYEARLPGGPVNVGYATQTKRLEFEGRNLVSFDD